MSLYRHDATGFLCEYATSPGAGYTAVTAFPGDTAGRISWWRGRCVDAALGQSSAWHPSLSSSTELSLPYGLAGRGVNVIPARYSVFNEADIPPVDLVNATAALSSGYIGQGSIRCQSSVANGTVWFAGYSVGDYNIPITAYRRWIVSAYVSAHTSGARSAKLVIKTNASGAEYEVPFTTGASLGAFSRVHGAVDLSADGSNRCMIGIRLPTTGTAGAVRVDADMIEELIGDTITPSAWVVGGGSTVQDGQIISLPGDIVSGFNVVASSLHYAVATSWSGITTPAYPTVWEPASGVTLPANNYRSFVALFVHFNNLVAKYEEGGIFYVGAKRTDGGWSDTILYGTPKSDAYTTGTWSFAGQSIIIDPNPGVGTITYKPTAQHYYNTTASTHNCNMLIMEFAR